MARLSLSCLGPFQVTLDGQPVTSFKSNKIRALLAYLAIEADRPHRRTVLAGLLWPDWPDRNSLSNLRYDLSHLRRVIGDRAPAGGQDADPPFLLVTRGSLQFNTASDSWLDVTAFIDLIGRDRTGGSNDLYELEQAAALYRGSFLEGFSLGDCAVFEEWLVFTREQLARQMASTLHRLAVAYENRGEYVQAQSFARRQIELEPWDEAAHRQLMRALALDGQRSAAMGRYEICRRLLTEELGAEPSAETTKLYEQIREGKLVAPAPYAVRALDVAPEPPPFLDAQEPDEIEAPVFFAREPELAQLDQFLDLALAGQGRVAFVTGEAGSGKTTLLQEFARRAQEAQADLLVVSGNCNAYTGIGDPYLPFREILELLTGDVESRWAAGAMTREHASRLWSAFPFTAQALIGAGLDLVDAFVPRAALLDRARAWAPGTMSGLDRLEQLVERKQLRPGLSAPEQSDLFEQYTRVLQAVTQQAPLLLVVDDLQWADLGSISLLFHLGRQLAGSRILIVGAYRPEEVALGRDGTRHPLESVANEFQRVLGAITVNLGQAGGWEFVQALLDSEPNAMGEPFRQMLYRQTGGHPLFTIELLRGLQERGDLIQDAQGRWLEGPALNWETLPARVEAVIAERIGRLDQSLQASLQVACVEGEVFTAEVVARVQAADGRQVVARLSGDLDRRHRLIRAQAIERLGSRRVSRYRFRNYLFQKFLYDNLDGAERAYLHEDVGQALEELYLKEASEVADIAAIAVQLARHFQEAGISDKAVHYLRQAGERAVQLSAYQEGIAHLTRGLALLDAQPDSRDADRRLERARQELALQLALGMAWVGAKGYGPESEQVYTRARELCRQMGETYQLCRVAGELSILYYVWAEHQRAREFAEEALSLAQQVEDPLLVAMAQAYLGFILFCLGQYAAARAHLAQVITFYSPEQHHRALVSLRGSDVGLSALAYDACCLWCLGHPDQALVRSREALALARELGHPLSLADALCYAGCLFNELRRDARLFHERAVEMVRLATEKLPGWLGSALSYSGQALAMLGHLEAGIAQIQEGLAHRESETEHCYRSGCLCSLAEAQGGSGDLEEGLRTMAEALAFIEQTNERYAEAEIHRVHAELLLMQGDEAQAEASLQQALAVARRQGAKSWELRATTSMARLWRKQGKVEEARQRLAEIYDWFTEGFDTADLREAKALLDELS